MPGYVALLRGINVGGGNAVAMADLRSVFESLGHSDVGTYIQSGNVTFRTDRPVRPETIEAALVERFGFDVAVVLREASDLARIVRANPFGTVDPKHLHVGFLAANPTAQVAKGLDPAACAPEEFVLRGCEIYLHLPDGMGRARLPTYLDRRLKIPTTIRNWNTVVKLAELGSG
jgi:uncharacterized protein (DUF1697 family)